MLSACLVLGKPLIMRKVKKKIEHFPACVHIHKEQVHPWELSTQSPHFKMCSGTDCLFGRSHTEILLRHLHLVYQFNVTEHFLSSFHQKEKNISAHKRVNVFERSVIPDEMQT